MKRKLLYSIFFLLIFCGFTNAQTVTGIITDQQGEALPGVSVLVKGTQRGTITDTKGHYSVNANSSNVLIFSFIGYSSTEEPVNGRNTINVSLEEDDAQLNEVVVTALGISKEKRALGYATSTVEAEEITRTASPTFANALYGKAPGVTIQATPGGATSGVSINIRGFSSITGNTQPLIVMDGIPIRSGEFGNTSYWSDQRIQGNGLTDINPNDIENISILKGASAAALYGSEAVNGVVLITTKKGKGRKGIGVDFNASYTVDKIAFLPRYQNVRGPGYFKNIGDAGQDENGFVYRDGKRGLINANYNFGPKFDGEDVTNWAGTVPYVSTNSGYDALFQDANTSIVSLAVSNGTEKSNTRFSFTRQDNKMISYNSKNEKNMATLSTSFKTGERFKTDLTINYINQYTKNRPYKVDRMVNNFGGMMTRFDDISWYEGRELTSLGYRFVTGTNNSLTPDENIPTNTGFMSTIMDYIYRTRHYNNYEKSNRVISSITETVQLAEGLSLRGRLGVDFTSMNSEDLQPTQKPLIFGASGSYSLRNSINTLVYGDAFLNYSKKLTPDLTLDLMGGYTARSQANTWTSLATNGGLSTEFKYAIEATTNQARGGSDRNYFVTDALLGTANFNYKNFFNVEGTIRRDRTSTMHPDNNTFVYPSVNSALVLSDAFNLPSAVSYSKLRASWGIVGNYPTAYQANLAYNQGSLGVQSDGAIATIYTAISANNGNDNVSPRTFGNDFIKPETKHEVEFGWETQFYNRRLGFDISYYNAKIVDQILPLSLPYSTGFPAILTNIGTLRNQGIDLAVNASPIRGTNFNWNVILNLSRNRNKVEKLANGATELLHKNFDGSAAVLKSIVGRPMGDAFTHPVMKSANGEDIINERGFKKLDPDEWVLSANAMPKLEGGLINQLSYKNISLDLIADFRIGGAIMPTGIGWMTSRGLTEESLTNMDAEHGGISYYQDENGKGVATSAPAGPNGEIVYHDGMLLEGVTADGQQNTNVISQAIYYISVYNWGGPQYGNADYSKFLKDATFAKMREISLSYKVPAAISSRLKTQNLTFSVYGRNLFFFYRTIKDMDPEQVNSGTRWVNNFNNAGNNPAYRSFGASVRASF